MEIQKLLKVVNKNKDIYEICKRLQILSKNKEVDINSIIQAMELPLNYHLFITGNFSNLMLLKY